MNMSRLEAAPLLVLQATTNTIPRPPSRHATNTSTNITSTFMERMRVRINNHIFSGYECEIACAIRLYIRNANTQIPSDETLGFVIKALRGEINGQGLPCQNMVFAIEHYETEAVRAIYLSVYCNRDYWYHEANKVWYAWLAQNDALVQRLSSQGALAPFLNPDGTLKTN